MLLHDKCENSSYMTRFANESELQNSILYTLLDPTLKLHCIVMVSYILGEYDGNLANFLQTNPVLLGLKFDNVCTSQFMSKSQNQVVVVVVFALLLTSFS